MSTKKNRSFPTMRTIASVVAGALVLLAALAGVMAARHTARPALAETVKNLPPAAMPQRVRPIANFESELITITPNGFEPREITRPQGRMLLMVDNRSGVAATALVLTSESGQRTIEMSVPREEPNWSEAMELPPGRYVLTEAAHPRWLCRLTITAR